MKDTETKARFIELRAEGQSYGKIADTLHISKSTCTAWEQELQQEIAGRERERLQELYSLYDMHKTNRIQHLGETLSRIDTALAGKDLAELPADKLLELKLKYERELKAEYVTPATPIEGDTLEAILLQYKTTLEKSQSGEYTPAQTKAQVTVIKEALQTMRAIYNRDNPLDFGLGGFG